MHSRKERSLFTKGVVLMLYQTNMNRVEKLKNARKTKKVLTS